MDERTARRVPGHPLSAEPNSFAEGGLDRVQRPLLSSSVVGTANRGLVIQALFDLGPTSRVELARHARVNRTTISGIVQHLIDHDVLVETEPGQSKRSGGKPARPLWFSPSARPICGVLLMPDAVRACLVALDGTIIGENRVALPRGDGPVAPIIRAVKKSVRSALTAAPRRPLGVGVAVGAMVDTDQGSIVTMNLAPSLDGYPLAGELRREFDLQVAGLVCPLAKRWNKLGHAAESKRFRGCERSVQSEAQHRPGERQSWASLLQHGNRRRSEKNQPGFPILGGQRCDLEHATHRCDDEDDRRNSRQR